MSTKLDVVAAIPNYNMADSLTVLLPQVMEQDYAGVYVLDDASTDHSREVAEQFGRDITFVAGSENIGSGGNRNRILSALGKDVLIHFLDADVRLNVDEPAARVREASSEEMTGLTGGLVVNPEGKQSPWNYGPRQCLHTDLGGFAQLMLNELAQSHPDAAAIGRRALAGLLKEWPNPEVAPQRRYTYWTLEANMAISSEVLHKAGGFDARIREHDIQDLAIRTQKLGLKSVFDPSFAVTQTNDINVRNYNRQKAQYQAEFYIARKNGLLQWLFPDGHLKPRYNQ